MYVVTKCCTNVQSILRSKAFYIRIYVLVKMLLKFNNVSKDNWHFFGFQINSLNLNKVSFIYYHCAAIYSMTTYSGK